MTQSPETYRLFIAMPLDSDVERALGRIIGDLRQVGADIRWVKPGNIHLTLRFLGDTSPAIIPKINILLDDVATGFTNMRTVIDRIGAFPNLRRPRVFWVGIADDPVVEQISKIARQVESGVRRLRFEKEKKGFRPHLTLGRLRRPGKLTELHDYIQSYRFDPIGLNLDRLVLFKSTLTPSGSIYERLHESPLGQPRFE